MIEELPRIASEGRQEAQRIIERLSSGTRIGLQTNELVLPRKDVSGFFRGQVPNIPNEFNAALDGGTWMNRLIYGDNLLTMQALLAGDPQTGLPSLRIFYVRKYGLMATYHPDFIVATVDKIYLIETKGDDKVDDMNVRQKQMATIEWIKKVNALKPEYRMKRTWEYVLIGESVFYSLSNSGASITDICNHCKVSYSVATGNLFDL